MDHFYKASKFYEMIGYEWEGTPLNEVEGHGMTSITKMLSEEYYETMDAFEAMDIEAVCDGLADLIFVALGAFHKLGINADEILSEVCDSNLTKTPGSSGRLEKDAVKGDDYRAPQLMRFIVSSQNESKNHKPYPLPDTMKRAAKLRYQKAQDYMSGGVDRSDYNPFGLQSYTHNVHEKSCRALSLVRSEREPNFESLRDCFMDLINYAAFAVEYIEGREANE